MEEFVAMLFMIIIIGSIVALIDKCDTEAANRPECIKKVLVLGRFECVEYSGCKTKVKVGNEWICQKDEEDAK